MLPLQPQVLYEQTNLANSYVPINAPLDQRLSIFSQPVPKCEAKSGPSHLNVDYVAHLIRYFLFVSSLFFIL